MIVKDIDALRSCSVLVTSTKVTTLCSSQSGTSWVMGCDMEGQTREVKTEMKTNNTEVFLYT